MIINESGKRLNSEKCWNEDLTKLTEGESKDLILKLCSKHKGVPISSISLRKIIFPKASTDNIKLLLTNIKNASEEVAEIRIGRVESFAISNLRTDSFLKRGGFTKLEIEQNALLKKQAEKERIEFEKSKIDLILKKWQVKTFWWIFMFAFIGFGLSVYNFTENLKPSKNTKLKEERIDKMESELETLRTSILNQKNLDSLHNSKEQNEILNKELQKSK